MIAVLSIVLALPMIARAQALDPPHLAGFPAVEIVKSKIQGSSPTDTLARQVAVLNYLPRIIQRMQMVPDRPYNSTTADERRIMDAYNLAAYELSQSYVKSASPEDAKAFEQMAGRYELDPALSKQMYGLLSPETRAAFDKTSAAASARAEARTDAQRRETEQAREPAPEPPPNTTPSFAWHMIKWSGGVLIYFAPTIAAWWFKGRAFAIPISVLNLLIAWTGVGWLFMWIVVFFPWAALAFRIVRMRAGPGSAGGTFNPEPESGSKPVCGVCNGSLKMTCPRCSGSGRTYDPPSNESQQCTYCIGSGQVQCTGNHFS